MAPNLMLEIKMVRKLVDQNMQDRFVQFLASVKTRPMFMEALPRFRYFNWELFDKISGNEMAHVLGRLEGANLKEPDCYVISEDPALDTTIMDTRAALLSVVGQGMATILIFGDVDLVYYQGHGIGPFLSRYLG